MIIGVIVVLSYWLHFYPCNSVSPAKKETFTSKSFSDQSIFAADRRMKNTDPEDRNPRFYRYENNILFRNLAFKPDHGLKTSLLHH